MTSCAHSRPQLVGETREGMGTVLVYWCGECGSLRRKMTNWKYTDSGWIEPKKEPLEGFTEYRKKHGKDLPT